MKTFWRMKKRALCMMLAIGLLIPAMPIAAVAAGHATIEQGIAGNVTTGEAPGTPVPGAMVSVWTTDVVEPSLIATTTADAEGFYEVELEVGSYYVEFEAEGYLGQYYDGVTDISAATIVTVSADTIDFVELWGADRYGTAIAVSQQSHPTTGGVEAVVIARGDLFPDALAGASLAGLHNAPILLTRPDALPAAVLAEIVRLDPREIYILGETHAVSAAVEAELAVLVGGTANVHRFGGLTRYETAVEIAEHVIAELGEAYDGTAFVARGDLFPDALAASPIMAAQGIPLFLAHPTRGLKDSTTAAMADVTEAAFIVGGPLAVSDEVEADLVEMIGEANVERVEGDNRYETAVAVAEFAVSDFGHVWEGVGIATGERFPDALTGGPYQGAIGSVMLLTRIATLPVVTATALETHNPHICETVHIYGGPAAVSAAVRTEIMGIVTPCNVEWVDVVLEAEAAALMLVKESNVETFTAAGDEIIYTFTLTNTGNVELDAPFEVFDSKVDTITLDPMVLAVDGSIEATASYTVTEADVAAGSVVNTATAQAVFDGDAVDSNEATATVMLAVPAIGLVVSSSVEETAAVGDVIEYTYTLTNIGDLNLAGPFSVVSSVTDTTTADPMVWASLPVGGSIEVTASYVVTADDLAAGITNDAYAYGWFDGLEIVSMLATKFITVVIPD